MRVAGTRWAIEECFEEAKGQVGLDQYEVGTAGTGTSMLAQAYLSVIKHQGWNQEKRGLLRSR